MEIEDTQNLERLEQMIVAMGNRIDELEGRIGKGSFSNLQIFDKNVEIKGTITIARTNFLSGTIRTTDATAVTADILTIADGESIFLMAKVKSIDAGNGYKGSFERNISVKNISGSITISPIQDAFTMRDDDYEVDLTESAGVLKLRVWGIVGRTIDWEYSVMYLK